MTLRAKIDLASGNLQHAGPRASTASAIIDHHRQGTKWCIYPMYDFAHPIQDALEGITHSLCSLEYRGLTGPCTTGWSSNVSIPYHKPRQIEFARLGIDHTVMSKRKLRQLVEERLCLRLGRSPDAHPVRPAPPGLHRRLHPQLLRAHRRGQDLLNTVEYGFLEHCLREDLNDSAQRAMAVLRPVKLTITNYPGGQERDLHRGEQPHRPRARAPARSPSPATYGWKHEDFLETPIPKYKRLYPDGPECRLKGAYLITLHRLRQG